MAIITLGGAIAEARGSIGGMTFSRNRGGAYIRNRSVPINPGSARQQAVRFVLGVLATRWVEVLTAAQRAAWETYADQVPVPNSLGQPRNIGGIAMFIRSNTPRLGFPDTDLTVVDDAPEIFDLSTFNAPSLIGVSEAAQTASWGFDEDDDWVDEDGSAMIVYLSRPQNPSVNYFKGPYQAAGKIDGDGVTPPTSPQSIDCPFPCVEGQKIFARCNVTRNDGRLSSSFRTLSLVSA